MGSLPSLTSGFSSLFSSLIPRAGQAGRRVVRWAPAATAVRTVAPVCLATEWDFFSFNPHLILIFLV